MSRRPRYIRDAKGLKVRAIDKVSSSYLLPLGEAFSGLITIVSVGLQCRAYFPNGRTWLTVESVNCDRVYVV